MSPTLTRYVARLYLGWLVGSIAALTVVWLVADFGDRLRIFIDRPVEDVARLYWFKALVALHQLGPAAMLLAGGAGVSVLRQRGEWVAMQAAGASRWVVAVPIIVCASLGAVGMVVFDELVVTNAGTQIDTIMVERFQRWGDFRYFYVPKQWFRIGKHIVQVRGVTEPDGALQDVTVFELDDAFALRERIDVGRLEPLGGSAWRARNTVSRTFLADDSAPRSEAAERTLALPGSSPDSFRIRTGRPELMRLADIVEQRDIRQKAGLATERFWLALHNRFAYPAMGVAASLLAVALALRPGRKGHLTLALVEGLGVAVMLFGCLLVGKSLALGQHISAGVASWAPVIGSLLGAAVVWRGGVRQPMRARR